jgi:hypothetical protein
MKPTVVAPTPGPVLPAGEVQLPEVPMAVVAGPEAVVAVVAVVVGLEELPQAVAAKASTPTRAAVFVRNRDMYLLPP